MLVSQHGKTEAGLLLMAVLVAAAGSVAGTPEPGSSQDGAAFPEAVEPRRVSLRMPVAQERLGARPDQIARRVFSTERSAGRLLRQQGRPVPDTDWFTLSLGGAAVVGFDLTDGRVTRLVYCYQGRQQMALLGTHRRRLRRFVDAETPSGWSELEHRADDLRVQIHSRTDPESMTGLLELRIHPADWYLLHNDVSARVERAMRDGRLVEGMARREALLVMGEPDLEKTAERGTVVLRWEEYREAEPREAVVNVAGTSVRVETPTPDRVKTRTVSAQFVDDRVVSVTETQHDTRQPERN